MPTPTVTLSVLVLPEVRDALRRLALVTRWSQAKLAESLILNLERSYISAFTEAELGRYRMNTMSHIEFRETQIRRRSGMKTADGAGAHPGQSKTDGHGEEKLPGDAANDTGPVKFGSVA
jgi:hypothetical protein